MLYIYCIINIALVILFLTLFKKNKARFKNRKGVEVSFSATLPSELQTHPYDKGTLVDLLTLGIFDSEGNELIRKTTQIEDSTMNFKIRLTKNKTYNIIFWGQYEESKKYYVGDMKSIKMLITDLGPGLNTVKQNSSIGKHEEGNTNSSSTHCVELFRFLSKKNDDSTEKCAKAKLKIFDVPTPFNLFTREMDDVEDFSLIYHAMSDDAF